MRVGVLAVLGSLAACTSSNSYGTGDSHPERTTAGAATGASSGGLGTSAGGTTGGSVSTAGTSSSSGSTTSGCLMYASPLNACDSQAFELAGSLVDAFTGQRLADDSAVQVLAIGDPSLAASGQQCGSVIACLDGGTEVSLEISGPNYVDTIVETLNIQRSIYYAELPLLSTAGYATLLGQLQDPTKPLVVFSIREPGNQGNCPLSGYSAALSDTDGGFIDAGAQYLSGTSLGPGDATTTDGLAVFFNLDPSLTQVALQITPPPGSGCIAVNPEVQMTGIGKLKPGSTTILPYYIWMADGGPVEDGGV